MKKLHNYRGIVGNEVIHQIYQKSACLFGKRIIHINSTFAGGGVAEMLTSLVPLLNDAGLYCDWRILRGTLDFFKVTKKFHNALQGGDIELTQEMKQIYLQTIQEFSDYALLDHDAVIIHDPQPLALVDYIKKQQPWLWRCHIDLSNPNPDVADFLMPYLLRYDKMIVSSENYKREELPIEQMVYQPIIDPLIEKNRELPEIEQLERLQEADVPLDKPLITQISRFDKWKDPVGVIEIYKKVREEVDCRLVLCGSMASDDPEGIQIYEEVRQAVGDLTASGDIILLTVEDNKLVNVLQRKSTVILQKSLREGFGLTVTEAMWKGTPVLASNIGGIPLQIKHKKTGFLFDPMDYDGFAGRVVDIIRHRDDYQNITEAAKESVRENFLVTRMVKDYIDVLADILGC